MQATFGYLSENIGDFFTANMYFPVPTVGFPPLRLSIDRILFKIGASAVVGAIHSQLTRLLVVWKAIPGGPIYVPTYIAMHVFGMGLELGVRIGAMGVHKLLGKREESTTGLRKWAWKLIEFTLSPLRLIDWIYSKIFGIRTSKEMPVDFPNRKKEIFEIVREIFCDQLVKIALFVSSWEFGAFVAPLICGVPIVPISGAALGAYGLYSVMSIARAINHIFSGCYDQMSKEYEELIAPMAIAIEEHNQFLKKGFSSLTSEEKLKLYRWQKEFDKKEVVAEAVEGASPYDDEYHEVVRANKKVTSSEEVTLPAGWSLTNDEMQGLFKGHLKIYLNSGLLKFKERWGDYTMKSNWTEEAKKTKDYKKAAGIVEAAVE